jgi:hypothetical protein
MKKRTTISVPDELYEKMKNGVILLISPKNLRNTFPKSFERKNIYRNKRRYKNVRNYR